MHIAEDVKEVIIMITWCNVIIVTIGTTTDVRELEKK